MRLFASVVIVAVATTLLGYGASWVDASDQRADTETLELISQDFAIAPDQPLTITFRPAARLVSGDGVRVETYPAIEDRRELKDLIANYDALGRASDSLSFEADAIATNADGTVTVTIPTESATRSPDAVQFPNQGLYPVLLRVVDENSASRGEVLTFVDRLPLPTSEQRGTLGIAAIASITAPPLIPGDDTPLPPAVLEQVQRLIDFPDSVDLTVEISPDVLARLDPDTLDQLRPVLARSLSVSTPRIPFDPSSAADAGLQGLFKTLLVEGEDQTRALGEVQTDRSVWLSPVPITTDGANLLRDGGVRVLVVTSETYKMAQGSIDDFFDYSQLLQTRLTPAPADDDVPCSQGCMPTAVLEPGFEALMRDNTLEPERKAAYLAAHLVLWRDSLAANLSPVTGHTLVLGMSDGTVPDPDTMRRTMEMALPSGAIAVTDLSDFDRKTTPLLLGGNEIEITLQSPVPVDISQRPATLLPVAGRAIAVASMLSDPAGRPERWQDTIETLYSTALDDHDVDSEAVSLTAEFDAITAAVVPRTPGSFTLSGRRTDVRLRFSNTSDETLLVVIQLDAGADKLQFPDGPQLVELPPLQITEVPVRVDARANGTVTVNLNVVTPEGAQKVMPTIAMQARVNTLTGLAQVITGAALLMLLTWWVHNLRRSRRARRSQPADTPTTPEAVIGDEPADELADDTDQLADELADDAEYDAEIEPDPTVQATPSASLSDS